MSSKQIYLNGPMNTFFINCSQRKEDNFIVQIEIGENNKSKQNMQSRCKKRILQNNGEPNQIILYPNY